MTRGEIEQRLDAARTELSRRLVGLGRHEKRALLVACDLAVLAFCLWAAFALRYGWGYTPDNWKFGALTALVPVLGVAAFAQAGLYRMVTRYIGGQAINRIASALLMSVLVWALLIFMSGLVGTPRTAMLLYWVFGACGTLIARQAAAMLLKVQGVPAIADDRARLPVLVWGAGPVGLELADALERSDRYLPRGFVDLNSSLWGQYVGGYKVFKPERLPGIIDRQGIKEVLLAIPQATRAERTEVLHYLEALTSWCGRCRHRTLVTGTTITGTTIRTDTRTSRFCGGVKWLTPKVEASRCG